MLRTYKHKLLIEGVKKVEFDKKKGDKKKKKKIIYIYISYDWISLFFFGSKIRVTSFDRLEDRWSVFHQSSNNLGKIRTVHLFPRFTQIGNSVVHDKIVHCKKGPWVVCTLSVVVHISEVVTRSIVSIERKHFDLDVNSVK